MSRIEETLKKELEKVDSGKMSLDMPARSVQGSREEIKDIKKLSAIQELSSKIDICLKNQHQIRFITKEISEIIKKSY